MTAYAPVPAFAGRKRHPRALLVIVGVHAAAIAVLMTAKMDVPIPFDPTVTRVTLVPEPTVPPENPPPQPKRQPLDPAIEIVPVPPRELPLVDPLPMPFPDPGPAIDPGRNADPLPKPAPVRTAPRFNTSETLLKPPYPQQKLRAEEEAVLRLKLSIDARGRVTAVDPVGGADPVFLAAARRHLLANWRYQPATEDGRPVPSSTVITLRFELDE